MELFSKLKTLIQINNSNNKTIKGNNNIITGNNSTVIQTPVSVEETTLILGETIVLSEFEKKILLEFAAGTYGVYANNEAGIMEQIDIVDGPKEISAYDINAINSYKNLMQYGFLSKNIINKTITITDSGRYYINTLTP